MGRRKVWGEGKDRHGAFAPWAPVPGSAARATLNTWFSKSLLIPTVPQAEVQLPLQKRLILAPASHAVLSLLETTTWESSHNVRFLLSLLHPAKQKGPRFLSLPQFWGF